MSIYATGNVKPYVYKCVEKNTGRFYIGYRYKNRVPADQDLGVFYFTSNDYVKKNFSNFDVFIVKEFETKRDAFLYETYLIKETKGILQINSDKYYKTKKKYEKNPINEYCLLPECGKYINSSIKKFCCRTHSTKFHMMIKQ